MNPLFLSAVATVVATIPYKSPEERDREGRARRGRACWIRVVSAIRSVRRWLRRLILYPKGGTP